jgi:large subunit ribosomal protein L17
LDNTTHSRRVVFSYLQNKESIKELFGVVAEKIGDRPGGYLRIIKLGFRRGDGADMAMIELVDFNEVYNPKGNKAEEGKKKTRRGRRTSKSADSAAAAVAAAPVVVAAPEVIEEVVDATPEIVEDVVAEVAETPETPAADDTTEEKTEEA